MSFKLYKALPVLLMVLGSAFSTSLALPLFSGESKPNLPKISVSILESSSIRINGKSNINQFTCSNIEPVSFYSKNVSYKNDQHCLFFENAFLKIASNNFDCGIRKLTEDFKELIRADQYPNLEITLHSISDIKKSMMSSMTIGIAGVYKAVHMPITLHRMDSLYKVSGSITLNISDFGLQAPSKLFGMIKVDETVKIDFELHIAEHKTK